MNFSGEPLEGVILIGVTFEGLFDEIFKLLIIVLHDLGDLRIEMVVWSGVLSKFFTSKRAQRPKMIILIVTVGL